MDPKPTILITGANRGIGLGLTLEFVRRKWRVFAACRRPAEADRLKSLALENGADLAVLPLEVRDQASIAGLAGELAARTTSLDVLVNNAGVHPDHREEKLGNLTLASVVDAFTVNTLGPIAVSQALLPFLKAGRQPRIVNISSGAGSLKKATANLQLRLNSISKAALNDVLHAPGGARPSCARNHESFRSPQGGVLETDMGGAEAEKVPLDERRGGPGQNHRNSSRRPRNGQWLDRFGKTSEFAW